MLKNGMLTSLVGTQYKINVTLFLTIVRLKVQKKRKS